MSTRRGFLKAALGVLAAPILAMIPFARKGALATGFPPSGKYGTVAWKTIPSVAVLNESWIAHVEVWNGECPANPSDVSTGKLLGEWNL